MTVDAGSLIAAPCSSAVADGMDDRDEAAAAWAA
jgi:hypothetical protein